MFPKKLKIISLMYCGLSLKFYICVDLYDNTRCYFQMGKRGGRRGHDRMVV